MRIAPGAFVFHRLRQPNSTIASNESFSGWTKTFTDPRLRAAIIEGQNLQGRGQLSLHSAADLP
jgi:hypothetical protein